MGRPQQIKNQSPDEQTLEAWENMRNEIWHELQEGASADVPDELVDDIGNLVVMLDFWRAEIKSIQRLPSRV